MQLRVLADHDGAEGGWEQLPEATQASALALLARLISNGVIAAEEAGDG